MTLTHREYTACLRRDFFTFLHRAFYDLNPHTPFLPNWHIEVMAAKLEACRLGHCRRLIINVPPRHAKSILVNVMWCAWEWSFHPETRWLYTSHSQDLTVRDSIKARRLLESPVYQQTFPGVVTLSFKGHLKQSSSETNSARNGPVRPRLPPKPTSSARGLDRPERESHAPSIRIRHQRSPKAPET